MANKINFEFVDKKYISYTVKNAETGRRYLQVTCPSCGLTFDKREFMDHVNKVHAKRRDEVLAKLFGHKEYPVICSDCGREVHFDEQSGTYSKKCRLCMEQDVQFVNSSDTDSIEELMKKKQNMEEVFKAKQQALDAQIEAAKKALEWKSVDIYSSKPRFLPDAQKFVRKISYELRVHATNGDKQKIYEILNFLDRYLDNEEWKKDKEAKDD